jgi:hypothetical protein
MMNLKEFATLSNCSLPKIKQYAQSIFGHIPDALDDQMFAQLSDAIASDTNTGSTKALTSSASATELATELTTELKPSTQDPPSNHELTKTFKNYLQGLKKEFLNNQFELDKAQFQLEQAFYAKLLQHQLTTHEESENRIRKNVQLWRGELATDTDTDNEKSAIYNDIAGLMEFFS